MRKTGFLFGTRYRPQRGPGPRTWANTCMRGQWWAPGPVSYPRLHAVLPGQRPSRMTLDCFPLPCSGILFHQLSSLVLMVANTLSSSTDVGLPSSLTILSYKWVKDGPWMLAPMLFVSSLISKQVPNSLPWVPNSNSYIPSCSTYSPLCIFLAIWSLPALYICETGLDIC